MCWQKSARTGLLWSLKLQRKTSDGTLESGEGSHCTLQKLCFPNFNVCYLTVLNLTLCLSHRVTLSQVCSSFTGWSPPSRWSWPTVRSWRSSTGAVWWSTKPTDWRTGTANCWRDSNSWTWSVCLSVCGGDDEDDEDDTIPAGIGLLFYVTVVVFFLWMGKAMQRA